MMSLTDDADMSINNMFIEQVHIEGILFNWITKSVVFFQRFFRMTKDLFIKQILFRETIDEFFAELKTKFWNIFIYVFVFSLICQFICAL